MHPLLIGFNGFGESSIVELRLREWFENNSVRWQVHFGPSIGAHWSDWMADLLRKGCTNCMNHLHTDGPLGWPLPLTLAGPWNRPYMVLGPWPAYHTPVLPASSSNILFSLHWVPFYSLFGMSLGKTAKYALKWWFWVKKGSFFLVITSPTPPKNGTGRECAPAINQNSEYQQKKSHDVTAYNPKTATKIFLTSNWVSSV